MFGCVHFSFFKATLDCHLTDAYALRLSSPGAVGFMSGPFHCWGGIPNQDKYVQLGPKTYVPKELGCMNLGVVYVPEMAPPRTFQPERSKGDLALGLNTIYNCRALCSFTVGCEHFSVHMPSGLCSLAAADARPVPRILSAISGRKAGGCEVANNAAVKDDVGFALWPPVTVRPKLGIARKARAGAIAVVLVATAAISLAALGLRLWGQRPHRHVLQHEVSALLGETHV